VVNDPLRPILPNMFDGMDDFTSLLLLSFLVTISRDSPKLILAMRFSANVAELRQRVIIAMMVLESGIGVFKLVGLGWQ
jgi:hypothetical protein